MSAFVPPDWRDASAYPTTYNDLSLAQWAWEFLRRNPEYQKDYEHFASLPDYHANGAKTAKWYCTETVWWGNPELRYCKYPLLPDEATIADYFHRTKDDTPFHYSLEDHLIEKWGLTATEIYDPSYDGGDMCLQCESELPKLLISDPEIHPELSQLHHVEPEGRFEITLRFDCRYSIEKQLEEAKRILLDYKEGLKEHALFPDLKNEIVIDRKSIQINKLPMYLRVYDGKQSGETFSEIGKVIFRSTEQSASADKTRAFNAFNKAKELVNGGYRELIKQT